MAWIDDRIWCHPKLIGLTANAKAAYVFGIAYSAGMGTGGRLEPAMQRAVGANRRTALELVHAGLWDTNGETGTVHIHDWDEHNGARDRSRELDRARKRRWRERQNGA
jgi:hypothetical protein